MKTLLPKGRALIAGLLAGIAAPATIGMSVDYPKPRGSDLNRIRGDVQRLGASFWAVIEREHGNKITGKK